MFDLRKLTPKQLFLLFVIVLAIYFSGRSDNDFDFIPATVTRTVDGDTIIVNADGKNLRVRLIGADTPETVHPKKPVQFYGKEASAFTKKILSNKKIWLEYDVSPLDKYKRHLAYIWLEIPERIDEENIRLKMFNARLILDGYAKTMNIKPNTKYAEIFKKFELEAMRSKKGLWKK